MRSWICWRGCPGGRAREEHHTNHSARRAALRQGRPGYGRLSSMKMCGALIALGMSLYKLVLGCRYCWTGSDRLFPKLLVGVGSELTGKRKSKLLAIR
ncbi:uncharacterized protein M421DRAFT_348489 [Didymella exigua CBS 183.55]|uniref:Uncharacterized protein n=1 Tax=Didymella exigua CBS 183.55 TaxID=1150837 RepID=A0A6A5R551_9PLEO|nr:uncharacterized protein M421DRAFT_348489 [Didymella exigua CBS 183.55]KAF1922773.1 hypothetical protein M421DRAFT_348489 [Didymella exigua CBS 183.55]